jgi:hypothetical protein
MSAASMRRRGVPARGSVSGSAVQGMRPREGIGATATFARCPAECAARILVRTLGLSSISLSGQSSWLADHWKTSRTPSSESTAWRVVSSRSRAVRVACSQGLRTAAQSGHVRGCPDPLLANPLARSACKWRRGQFSWTWKIAHKPRTARYRGWVTRPFHHKSHKPRFLSARS